MFFKKNTFVPGAFALLLAIGGCAQKDQTKKSRRTRRSSVLPTKGIRQVTLDEALLCKNYYKKTKDLDLAAKYVERALALAKDHTLRSELTLEIADMYTQLGYGEKASKYYNQFKTLYPGSKNIKYVLYREIISNEADLLDSARDQGKTLTTLTLAQDFLTEYPDDADYGKIVQEIIQKLYVKLFKSELGRARFYLNKYSYEPKESSLKAAHKRLQHIFEEYIPELPGAQKYAELEKSIKITPIEIYRETLENVAAQLADYLADHEQNPRIRFHAHARKQ